MANILRKTAAILLALTMLTGCAGPSLRIRMQEREGVSTEQTWSYSGVTNADLVYTRPDLGELEEKKQQVLSFAETGTVRQTINALYEFYDVYDWFYTFYALADIRYSADLTDPYWEEEYAFCMDAAPQADAAMEDLYYGLAASPLREKLESSALFGPGFFDSYEGENRWDEGFLQLLEEENALINRYYTLTGEALEEPYGSEAYYDRWGDALAGLLVELIALRKAQADYWGYDSYPEFAWDFTYDRDFTPAQALDCYDRITRELVPLYRETADSDVWNGAYRSTREEKTFAYVRTAAENMGGLVWDAFTLLEQGELYDIGWGANKYTASFAYYLTGYGVPFVFVTPSMERQDHLTFAHEFGHFCMDYVSGGSTAGIDVGEIFSQGMEYLSLTYGNADESLTKAKLADCLATYVEQAAYGSFEQRMYDLEGDDLSVEGLYRLYEEVAEQFGFDAMGYDCREFVDVNHFYTNPLYLVSYVLSNDAALQLYQLEQEAEGSGAALFQEHLATQEPKFLAFLETAGLESPFAPGRMAEVAALLREKLT